MNKSETPSSLKCQVLEILRAKAAITAKRFVYCELFLQMHNIFITQPKDYLHLAD